MMRRVVCVVAVVLGVAGVDTARSNADPAGAQADTACAPELDGALTKVGASNALLRCGDGRWQAYAEIYPSSDRWLSDESGLTVYGQGRRNPELLAGAWTALPQNGETRCGAEQVDVVGAGLLGEPQTVVGEPGQPLVLPVSAKLFKVTLTGNCLWRRNG